MTDSLEYLMDSGASIPADQAERVLRQVQEMKKKGIQPAEYKPLPKRGLQANQEQVKPPVRLRYAR